jgi:hypothetical protein
MLKDLIDDTRTDKNSWHNYLETYERKFKRIKYSALNVLEIGIDKGGSIKLWHDYFPNATIYGLDVMHIDQVDPIIKNNDRIKLMTSTNAYDLDMINREFVDKGIRFDMILDDGPHSFDSMLFFAKYYSKLLTNDGILILEDVQSMDWLSSIITSFDSEDIRKVQVIDLRPIRNVYDDILVIFDKSIDY